ncbi:Ankyrin repeat, PH and SEC7 domain containing protein secG, partial [Symbiodinium microadriaticum]
MADREGNYAKGLDADCFGPAPGRPLHWAVQQPDMVQLLLEMRADVGTAKVRPSIQPPRDGDVLVRSGDVLACTHAAEVLRKRGVPATAAGPAVARNGWRLDKMEAETPEPTVGPQGIGQLVVAEGFFIGEKDMFKICNKQGRRYRMRPFAEERKTDTTLPGIFQLGPFKIHLEQAFRGGAGSHALFADRPEGALAEAFRGGAGSHALFADRPEGALAEEDIPTRKGGYGSEDGTSPLHLAAKSGELEVVVLLLDAGAPLEAEDYTGATALHWAAANGCSEVTSVLLARGASPAASDRSGAQPLHDAAWSGHSDAAKALLRWGASTDATDDRGRTPLHCAALLSQVDIVEQLLESGAPASRKDDEGKPALELAQQALECLG